MRKILSLLAVLVLFCTVALAQTRTVTGQVLDENGNGVPFATVTETGTKHAVTADGNGNFSISVASNATLTVTSTGFKSQVVTPGSGAVTVGLVRGGGQLDEVIVTALGIRRSQRSISYSAQQISGDRMTITREANINNALAGKVSGVQLLGQSGGKLGAAGATQLRIRGAISFSGDGGPLYVIDGTPTSNINELNMDDVESVSVLKGPNANALYGARAVYGVVVVTTKKGRRMKGIGIEYNHTTTLDVVGKLPKYQNKYAGGDSGGQWLTYTWAPGNPVEWQALSGKKYHDYTDDSSWGPPIDGSEYIPWYAWYPGTPYSFKTASLTAQPNNIREFYNKGVTINNNVNFSKAGDGFSTRVSYTNLYQTGILPNTRLNKNFISTQNSVDLGTHFTVGGNINYTNERLQGEFNDQYSNPSSGSFNQWFHRDLDMKILKELQNVKSPLGAVISFNHADPTATTNYNTASFNKGNYWFNPYFYFNNIDYVTNRDRLIGDVNLTFKLNNHFKIAGFLRRNQLTTNYENKIPYIIEFSGIQVGQPAYKNSYSTGQTFSAETNYEALASYTNKFSDFDVELNAGANMRDNFYREILSNTNDGLVIPDVYTISNSKSTPTISNRRIYSKVNSLYARASVGYRNMLFLDAAGREDWFSIFPADNNHAFTPSVGLSFVFSELTKNAFPVLSYGKVRASVARLVTEDLGPYALNPIYGLATQQYNGNLISSVPTQIIDPNIQPAISTSSELGLDLKFLRDRVGISATAYREDRKNETIPASISSASGATSALINAGLIRREGIELTLDGTPVQSKDFTWNSSLNFAVNKSKVIEILPDNSLKTLQYASGTTGTSSFSFVSIVHVLGEEWGQMRGTGIQTINGQPVLDANGLYVPETNKNFGSILPRYTGGWFNNFNYKGINLGVSIDFQKGGKFFSLSEMWGDFSGLYEQTAAINDRGHNVREDVAAGGGVHVTGVDASGHAVDTYVEGYDYFHQFYFAQRMAEKYVHDASYIKLREVSLGYELPVNKIFKGRNPFQRINVSLVGRNLLLLAHAKDNTNWDPSEFPNRYGENGGLPSTRSFGINLKFGF